MQEFTNEYEEYYGDEPEGVWAKCDKCDIIKIAIFTFSIMKGVGKR